MLNEDVCHYPGRRRLKNNKISVNMAAQQCRTPFLRN